MMKINKFQLEIKLKIKWWPFCVLKIIRLLSGKSLVDKVAFLLQKVLSKVKVVRVAKEFWYGRHGVSVKVMKVLLKRDTHTSRNEAKLLENKNLARNRKEIIEKVSLVIFSLYPISFITFWCFSSLQIIVLRI